MKGIFIAIAFLLLSAQQSRADTGAADYYKTKYLPWLAQVTSTAHSQYGAVFVINVLNYTTTGNDEGREGHYWRLEDGKECTFSRFIRSARDGQPYDTKTYDLNDYDPRYIKTEYVMWSGGGEMRPLYYLMYDGKKLFRIPTNADPERVMNGWKLIYEKYCEGKKSKF